MGLMYLNSGYDAAAGRWLSDVFTPATANISVGVEFEDKNGSVVIERSIDGVNWVAAGIIAGACNNTKYVLMNVSGFVLGTYLRILTSEKPQTVHYME